MKEEGVPDFFDHGTILAQPAVHSQTSLAINQALATQLGAYWAASYG